MALHEAGYAHSVEVWDRSGNLAGGLYGMAIGKAFFTESMFARQPDASKVAFIALSCHLQLLNDGKHDSPHLAKLGFRLMPKAELNLLLTEACAEPGKPAVGPSSRNSTCRVGSRRPAPAKLARWRRVLYSNVIEAS